MTDAAIGGHLPTDQIGGERRQPLGLLVRPPVFDRDVPALDIAGSRSPEAGPWRPGRRRPQPLP